MEETLNVVKLYRYTLKMKVGNSYYFEQTQWSSQQKDIIESEDCEIVKEEIKDIVY